MVVGVCEVGDGVVEFLVDLGALLLGCVAAETECVCADVCDRLELDLRLPKLFEVSPCFLIVGTFVPLFVLCAEQSCLDD